MPASKRGEIAQLFKARNNYLIGLIQQGSAIRDDSLQAVVDRVMSRLVAGNQLNRSPKLTLILKDPTINAFCYGEGTFAVTIGLLSRIHSGDDLAFTLAHELAHFELDHVMTRLLKQVESDYLGNYAQDLPACFQIM